MFRIFDWFRFGEIRVSEKIGKMENDTERGDGLASGDRNNAQNGGDGAPERFVLDSDELKDSEEEIFEEASDSHEKLQELGETSESGDSVETADDVGMLIDENPSLGKEFDAPENAARVDVCASRPSETGFLIGEKEQDGMSRQNIFASDGVIVNGVDVQEVGDGKPEHAYTESSVVFLPNNGLHIESKVCKLDAEAEDVLVLESADVSAIIPLETNAHPSVILDKEEEEDHAGEDVKLGDDAGSKPYMGDLGLTLEHNEDNNGDMRDVLVAADLQHDEDKTQELNFQEAQESTDIVADGDMFLVEGFHENLDDSDSKHHKNKIETPGEENDGFMDHYSVIFEVKHEDNCSEEKKWHHHDSDDLKDGTSGDPEAQECVIASPDVIIQAADNSNSNLEVDMFEVKEEHHLKDNPQLIASFENGNGVQREMMSTEEEPEKRLEEQNTGEIIKHEVEDETRYPLSKKTASPALPSAHPAGLGLEAPLMERTSRPMQQQQQQQHVNGTVLRVQSQQVDDNANGEADEGDETREKLQMVRVKFLRLAHRLGQTPHNVVVAQVLYRLGLAEQLWGRNGSRVGSFSFDRASAMAEQLEASAQDPLDFSCTIMVLGKTGVGKSATINSIFDDVKFRTDPFQSSTGKVQDVVGTVYGIKVRVIDTPGLLPSCSDRYHNEKILHSVKKFIKKSPPDIVLYLDRLDMQSRDFGDTPLLRSISDVFGPSIWFNAIVVLTHAASAPPDGPNGSPSSYDMFVTQRSHVIQQTIRHAAGDMRLMNPVSLVENHSACRTNRAGQRVLPNGQVWKPHLLLLSFASKILAEANALLKLQDSQPGKLFTSRSKSGSNLSYLLSSLLHSRAQVKLPEEQHIDEDVLDNDGDDSSDSEDDLEYDDLPPFKSLTKTELAKLSKAQKKAYLDELEYREKLFVKKHLKQQRARQKMVKMAATTAPDLSGNAGENKEEEEEGGVPASVPVPIPDLVLPASFDSDNPTHRYRYLDNTNPWLVRPVLENHGWDHDVGYEGVNVERTFAIRGKVPVSFSGQVTKEKRDTNIQMEITSSIKHGGGGRKATLLGFDTHTRGRGKELSYTLRGETKFCNYKRNKGSAGLSLTYLEDALSAGVKLEDKIIVNKRFRTVLSGGAVSWRGDVAYGASLEAQLRDADYPIGRFLSTLGLSVMDWQGNLAVGCNLQSQVPIGRSTNLTARANLSNVGPGQITIRLSSSEHIQIALIGLVMLKKLFSNKLQLGD